MDRSKRTSNRSASLYYRTKCRLERWWHYCSVGVWNDTRRRWSTNIVKVINLSVRSFLNGDLQSKACAMTYRTVLALVPALALVCAIARGFGYQDAIMNQLIRQLPAQKDALTTAFGFVDSYLAQASGGVFVGVGVVFLFWTIISLIHSIEMAFNSIWQVEKGRSCWRMATDYLAIIIILPILLICSNGLTIMLSSSLQTLMPFDFLKPAVETFLDFLSLVIIWLFFTGTFMLIPNTKVRFRTAIIPGILVGSACQLLQWIFISGQIYVARYNAIYGSFSFLPLLLIWMQCVWLLTLTGGVLCYAIQNMGEYNFGDTIRAMSDNYRYQTSVAIMTIIAQRFDKSLGALNASEMGQLYRLPVNLINPEIERLRAVGLVNFIDGDGRETTDRKVQPGENVANLTVADVVDRLSNYGTKDFIPDFKSNFKPIESIFKSIRKSASNEGLKTRLIDIPLKHTKKYLSQTKMKQQIATNNAPGAIGPYSQAIRTGNMLFISGQIPVDPATGNIPEGITAQTQQSINNIKAILSEAGMTIDNVVKTTVFLADMSLFVPMNEVYAANFTAPFPARSAVAVKELPKQVLVEIETIAAV